MNPWFSHWSMKYRMKYWFSLLKIEFIIFDKILERLILGTKMKCSQIKWFAGIINCSLNWDKYMDLYSKSVAIIANKMNKILKNDKRYKVPWSQNVRQS